MINVGGKNVSKQVSEIKVDVTQRAINPMATPYNAIGNGIVDDAAALQAAFTAATGKIVLIPSGYTFKTLSTLSVPDNTTIIAYGAKIMNTSTHITMLSLGNGCKVYGLEVEGAGNSVLDYNGHAMDFKGNDSANYKSGLLLEDCYIHGFAGYGLFLQFSKNVTVNKCRFESIGYAGIHGLSVTNVIIDKSKVKGITPGTGVLAYGMTFTRTATTNDLTTYPRSKDCKVTNCVVEDVPLWEGLDTHAGENIIFENNTIRNCKTGIAIVPSANGSVTDYAPQYCKAIGNTIYGNGNGFGIALSGAGSGTIGTPTEYGIGNAAISNTLINCGEQTNNISGALYIKETYGTIVQGNNLKDCYAHGINLYQTNRGFVVEGNTIIDVQDSTNTVPSGVVVRDQYNFGFIGGNSIIKVNASLNTFVMVRGVFVQATANIDINLGVNYSTADSPLFISTYSLTSYGSRGNGTAKEFAGTGSPEGVITGSVGSTYRQLNGGAGTTLWVKESGTGNTGWVPLRGGFLTSISATPTYTGQEALVSGVWYKAKNTTGTGDWVALN